jgi:hypothetical protein
MRNTINKILLGILGVFVVIAIALLWFVFNGESLSMAGNCSLDIESAQEYAEGRICTLQIQNLQCPYEEGTVYVAPNGCVISQLKNKGWTEAEGIPLP